MSSTLFAVLLIVPAVIMVRSIGADVRVDLAERNYSDAAQSATKLQLPANTCRLALLLPGPATLHFVPGLSRWFDAGEYVCEIGYDTGVMAQLPSVRAVAAALDGRQPSDIFTDAKLLGLAATASADSESRLRDALQVLHRLDALGMPGDFGRRVHTVSTTWPPDRLQHLQPIVRVSRELLGFDRPRTYFVALQSEAEMRATGGFLGQFAIVRFANGKPTILKTGLNSELRTPSSPGVKLLPNTEVLTLTDNPMPANSNLSPHGPDVAAIWLNTWKQQSGQQLDGAIALDVDTAAALVASAGDTLTKPDGTVLRTASDMAAYAQNGVYFDFDGPGQSGDPRKAYQLAVFRELLTKAASSVFTMDALVRVLPNSVGEGRLLLYFTDSNLEQQIAASPIAKDLRQLPEQLFITWNNWAGNKFDYYIRPTASLRCVANGMELRMQVRAVADPKQDYPAYIEQRLDTPSETRPSVRDQWLLVLPRGSNVRWLSVNGLVARYDVVDFGGRPVVQFVMDTAAGQTHDVRAGIGGVNAAMVQVIGTNPASLKC